MQYTRAYMTAINSLIAGKPNRQAIARALCDLRRMHGRERAQRERRHMLFVHSSFRE